MTKPGGRSERAPALRDATVTDAATIADIYNESVAVGDASMDEAAKRPEDFATLLSDLGEREAIVLLTTAEHGEVLGWGMLKLYSDRHGYRFAAETTVYLRREHTGRGHGSHIARALVARARQHGFHHLVARVMADNELSMAFHRKHGYELVGLQKEIGFRDGTWRDVAILQRLLSSGMSSRSDPHIP